MEHIENRAWERAEEGWPCQRLRVGWSLVLFFLFETTIGQKLPEAMPYLALGLGLASLLSAMYAIRTWKLKAQIALIQDALEQRPV